MFTRRLEESIERCFEHEERKTGRKKEGGEKKQGIEHFQRG